MNVMLRKFLRKAAIVAIAFGGYSVWLWHGLGLGFLRVAANALSVIGMVMFVWGLMGLVHNTHALAAFTYSLRYVLHMVRNVRNKDDATNKDVISYVDYVAAMDKRENVAWCMIAAAGFTLLSLLLWLLS